MNHDIRKVARRAACALQDHHAERSGRTAAEMLVRKDARPEMFADACYREVWVAKETKRRLARRRRFWI